MADSANAVSSWFHFDYFFVKQLEIFKRGNTNFFGTHKHLTINPTTLTLKRNRVNELYPCNSYALRLFLYNKQPAIQGVKQVKSKKSNGIINGC